jgi:nitrate reductase gamma subunit
MYRKSLIIGSALAVMAGAVVVILAILDLITVNALIEHAGKLAAVIAVGTLAVLILQKLFALIARRPDDEGDGP